MSMLLMTVSAVLAEWYIVAAHYVSLSKKKRKGVLGIWRNINFTKEKTGKYRT